MSRTAELQHPCASAESPNAGVPVAARSGAARIIAPNGWARYGRTGRLQGLAGLFGLVLSTVVGPCLLGHNGAAHWAFQPLRHSILPTTGRSREAGNPVDCFILKALEEHSLAMSPEADRRILLRRATFDLTGMPPTPEEIDAFLADESPDAFEGVVDRLLASPRYGERWGRHWLDLVRYADTAGNSGDFPVPTAWLYRNYVIHALNGDRPFDRFIQEQIAGDLLPAGSEAERHENIIATGYLAISRRFGVEEKEFHQTIEDTISNLGQAFLGLSIQCARCHDHKFDPVTNHDYYALYGIFESTRYAFPGTEVFQSPKDFVPLVSEQYLAGVIRPFEEKIKAQDVEIERLRQLTLTFPDGPERDNAVVDYGKARTNRVELLKHGPKYPRAYAVSDASPVDSRVQRKGNPLDLGDKVPRRFLSVFGGEPVRHAERTSGRADLAGWLTSPRMRPLTARVMVNRVWQHHFGRGIVRTPNDFGSTGLPPTHPELLDYLAARWIDSGWSLKSLHRLIMLSRTYRQAGVGAGAAEMAERASQIDPDNQWLWRFNRRRLSAEELRDSLLEFSGELDSSQVQGHAFPPEYEWKFGQHTPYMGDLKSRHRSVYVMRQRLRKDPFLATFDAADTNVATGQRSETTTPIQALWLMNNPECHAQARGFASRILALHADDPQRVRHAHALLLGRPPDDQEINLALQFIQGCTETSSETPSSPRETRQLAWASYLRTMLCSNEFLHVE